MQGEPEAIAVVEGICAHDAAECNIRKTFYLLLAGETLRLCRAKLVSLLAVSLFCRPYDRECKERQPREGVWFETFAWLNTF